METEELDPAKHSKAARGAFNCGIPELNDFLQRYAHQQQKRGINKTYVAASDQGEILGFYSISSGAVGYEILPESEQKKAPRHPVPTALIGRLAIDSSAQGTGLGGRLLRDALMRIQQASQIMGVFAVVVDAKNGTAKRFYEKYGFVQFSGHPMKLFIPMRTIARAIQ